MDKDIRNVCIGATIASSFLLALYFILFHSGFSNDSSSWSDFGDYCNGIITPILTAVNIYVFIRLTSRISEIESNRAQEILNQEKNHFDNELKQSVQLFEKEKAHEKELLLMQLRKQELDVFIKQTNRIFAHTPDDNYIITLKQVADYLQSFSDTGLNWFEIDDGEKTKYEIKSLWNKLNKYVYNIEEGKPFDEDVFYKIYDTKTKVTNILFEATMGKMK